MGSAASIATLAKSPSVLADSPAAQAVLEAVRAFHEALIRLTQLATTAGPEQDVLKSHAKADLTSLLASFTPDGLDWEVGDVACDLGTQALGKLLQLATTTGVREEEMPPGPLRDFVPISLVPDVVKCVDATPMFSKEGQRDFASQFNKQSAKNLRGAVAELCKVMRTSVVERCQVENIAKTCHEVVDAGNADFRPIYESVWHRVEENEMVHIEKYREVAAGMTFPLAQAVQTAKDPVELLEHASSVQPKYRRIIGKLVSGVSGAESKIPTVCV